MVSGIWAEIWTEDLPSTKHGY